MTELRTTGLRKSFGSVVAVNDVDFSIDKSEIVGIIGPNGAGKTTFVNLVAGDLRPDDGDVSLDGTDITDEPVHRRAQLGVTRSFQITNVCDELTALENIRVAILAREGRLTEGYTLLSRDTATRDEAMELLAQLGLEEQATLKAATLPHGDRSILDVAMSAVTNPQFLILDEPTSGVATSRKRTIVERILDYITTNDIGVIFISHDMSLIETYTDRVMAMVDGEKATEGDPQTVLENHRVQNQILGGGE